MTHTSNTPAAEDMANTTKVPARLPLLRLLACAAAVVTLSMGIRHGFGLWLQPMVQSNGWPRELFSMGLALQNLAWGVSGIAAGMLSDRFGAWRVLLAGSLIYALGLCGMAFSTQASTFIATAGILIGLAQAGTTYAVVYGVIGRHVDASQRSWAMGVTAAAGSFGQFLMVPIEGQLILQLGWHNALLVLAALSLLIAPLAWGLYEGKASGTPANVPHGQTAPPALGIWQALHQAFTYRSFQYLMAGYFVCGFQVVFIGVHLPSYLKDKGLQPEVASIALALIGLFNVIGTYAAGWLGQRQPKRWLLAFIYGSRSVVIGGFLLLPLSPISVYIFAALIGLLWLSTVPLTNATVAQIFGVRHLSMLGGFVFCSHQIGSFLGVWLGGFLYDLTGHYDMVWGLSIALGVAAALINLPIQEKAYPVSANSGATVQP